MSSDETFVSTQAEIPETNLDAEKEDQLAAESEETGQVSQQEVEGLKDSLGGGQILDDSESYTRSSNKDQHVMQADDELDAKVEEAAAE